MHDCLTYNSTSQQRICVSFTKEKCYDLQFVKNILYSILKITFLRHPWCWMELWAPWDTGRCPCHGMGWNKIRFKLLPIPNHAMILWFCECLFSTDAGGVGQGTAAPKFSACQAAECSGFMSKTILRWDKFQQICFHCWWKKKYQLNRMCW